MMEQQLASRLGTGRWTVPLLACLSRQNGARFAALLAELGIARESLVRVLAHVTASGWVARNPGYGHPLRPEYVLTAPGLPVAATCARMMAVRQRLGLTPLDMSQWTLPILWQLGRGPARFSDLGVQLAPVTSRALSMALKQTIGSGLVHRQLEAGFPPFALYDLARAGQDLVRTFRPEPLRPS